MPLQPQVRPPTFFFFLPNLIELPTLGRNQRKVPGMGSGPGAGNPPLKRESERRTGKSATDRNTSQSRGTVAFTPPLHSFNAFSSTASSLCCSFSILLFLAFLYLTPSLSSVPISLPPSLPAHSALLVCCNGPRGRSWLPPTKYNEQRLIQEPKDWTGQRERERGKCCSPYVCVCVSERKRERKWKGV